MRLSRKVTGIFLAISLLLTACSSAPPPAAPSKVAKEAPEGGQTITVINQGESSENKHEAPATATKSGSKKYQIQTRLTDFQLLSATTGLAWGCTRSELRLYITQDNGKTWANISPAASVQFPRTPEYGKDIFFIDPYNGWIVRNAAGSGDAIVLRTSDGGTTWKIASFPGTNQVTAMYFSDAMNGWILSGDNSDTDQTVRTLFKTEDGGATWEPTITSNTALSNGAASSKSSVLPNNGVPVSLSFINENEGFFNVIKDGQPALYVTKDGGMDWQQKANFFQPSKYKKCTLFDVKNVTFFQDNHQEGWIPVGCSRGNATKFNGYFTKNAGNDWQLVIFQLSWQTGINEGLAPTFLNSQEGWTILDSIVYHTVDQGKTWGPLPESSKLKSTLRNYPEIVKLQFFTSQVGWLLVAKEDQKRSLLLQTKDGGVTWQVL